MVIQEKASVGGFAACGRVAFEDPQEVCARISAHFEEHGLEAVVQEDGRTLFEFADNMILLGHDTKAVLFEVTAATQNGLLQLRVGAARQVAEIDPAAVDRLEWDDGGAQEGVPENFRELRLTKRQRLSERLIRLTLEGHDLDIFTHTGLHVRLLMQSNPSRTPVWPVMRSSGVIEMPKDADSLYTRVYTIRAVRPDMNEVDIDFVIHAAGVATEWAVRAPVGAVVGITGPGGGFGPPPCDWLLMGGDLTATPAIARVLEMLPEDARGHVFLTVPDDMAEPVFAACPARICVQRLSPDADAGVLVNAMQLVKVPDFDNVYGWFAGEFSQAQAMRKYFKSTLGLKKRQQLSVAYWREGEAGQ
ncbi:siderophore-interacting protein [Pyruvatibacter sp.]|uniref:siderophore-interacting protein n=1 Tax=Pyruvatibacter sp. TaxID=1981328 RepID=UPI0032634F97